MNHWASSVIFSRFGQRRGLGANDKRRTTEFITVMEKTSYGSQSELFPKAIICTLSYFRLFRVKSSAVHCLFVCCFFYIATQVACLVEIS